MPSVITRSAEETFQLGAKVGSLLQAGDFIALTGDLGSGKTQFAKGVAAGLSIGSSVKVVSPTYTLLNIYQGRLQLYHFDLYRLSGDNDVVELGFSEYFYGDGISLVEWAERLKDEMPVEHLLIKFFHEDEESRRLELTASGVRYEKLLSTLFKAA